MIAPSLPLYVPSIPPELMGDTPDLAEPRSSEWPSSKKGPGVERRRVLVVDDEALIADSVAAILIRHGFEAIACYSAKSAIGLTREFCPHIIVSDVLMPELNGVELAIAVQTHCPDTRIVLFSGQAATADILRKAYADGFSFELLPKPIHPTQLLKVLSAGTDTKQ